MCGFFSARLTDGSNGAEWLADSWGGYPPLLAPFFFIMHLSVFWDGSGFPSHFFFLPWGLWRSSEGQAIGSERMDVFCGGERSVETCSPRLVSPLLARAETTEKVRRASELRVPSTWVGNERLTTTSEVKERCQQQGQGVSSKLNRRKRKRKKKLARQE